MSTQQLRAAKRALRTKMRATLGSISADVVARESAAVAERLFTLPQWKTAKSICIFMSMEKELQTRAIVSRALSEGKHCYVPRILDGSHMLMLRLRADPDAFQASRNASGLVPNSWGIPEPRLPSYWTEEATALACADHPIPSHNSADASVPAAVDQQPSSGAEELLAAFTALREASPTETGAGEWQRDEARDLSLAWSLLSVPHTGASTPASDAVDAVIAAASADEDDYRPLDLVLLPGVAFDAARNRIGYGRGYYDRYIRSLDATYAFVRARAIARVAAAEATGETVPPAVAAAAKASTPALVGLCLAQQVVEEVPVGPSDVPLDVVVTPSAVL